MPDAEPDSIGDASDSGTGSTSTGGIRIGSKI